MDSAHVNKTRKFPAYTLAQLENAVANPRPATLPWSHEYMTEREKLDAMMRQEIADRKSGKSKAFRTPQIRSA